MIRSRKCKCKHCVIWRRKHVFVSMFVFIYSRSSWRLFACGPLVITKEQPHAPDKQLSLCAGNNTNAGRLLSVLSLGRAAALIIFICHLIFSARLHAIISRACRRAGPIPRLDCWHFSCQARCCCCWLVCSWAPRLLKIFFRSLLTTTTSKSSLIVFV